MVQLYDQAEGLRRALVGDYVRTLLVAGTQYQIEKSGFIFNFVRSLVVNGYQVLVIDLSQERKPLSEIFGIYPRYDLLHLVEGKALLDEVLYPIETGALLL
ncbi:MAG: hypothetical protein KGL58_00945, partial [Pseudomonadota bacterium]|nr:hypothetical protein [Pseudomonadota bacterium]